MRTAPSGVTLAKSHKLLLDVYHEHHLLTPVGGGVVIEYLHNTTAVLE